MKLKTSIYTLLLLFIISCSNTSNSEAFINKTTGRYLYNSDELITVYFNDNTLFLKWRGATAIKPLKIDENTFFVKEMNEKIQFLNNPSNGKAYLVLVPKENESLQYNFKKLDPTEKTPSEYLANHEFDKALEAYFTIQKNDSLDPTIEEQNFNRLGYQKLKTKNYEEALQIFKINIALYPYSSNVYDSYADALKRNGDTLKAIEFYKKSVSLDSGNKQAKRFIEKYDKK
ncbi:hypothetical protein SAMN06265371_101378 [Lutibacter agarilyticus]|uniref:Uncharacterized protein n=1 Tax=Lutibacter agarilyticus TaxID=1109740 RepID=A0A238VI13_9FLAO|nr:hypothetical protein [Lutibacter agarilyticus]SNR33323.1 hypothetical protein SAMN06265371_101378 [Lutibacter agarilyticus]